MGLPNLSSWGFAKRHLREVASFVLLLIWKLFEDRILGWANARIDEKAGVFVGVFKTTIEALPFLTTVLLILLLIVFVLSTLVDSLRRMNLAFLGSPMIAEVHRFPAKRGRPTIYLQANGTIRLLVPVSIVVVGGSVKSEFLRVGLRLEGKIPFKGWRILKEDISLESANDRQLTAWDYHFEIPANVASPIQDLVFHYSWVANFAGNRWPKRARLVLWARITGLGHWERVLSHSHVQWVFPQIGETGIEFQDDWDFSGGRTWTGDGTLDQHIWNM